jgi:hypothetical protein
MFDLNREKWGIFKRKHNLSKSSIFNRADVGPHIDRFETALATFNLSKSKQDLGTAFKRLEELEKAFDKFMDLKKAKLELSTDAETQIKAWKKQLDELKTNLRNIYQAFPKRLEAADRKQLDAKLKRALPGYK